MRVTKRRRARARPCTHDTMSALLSYFGILFMRGLARLPLAWVRALGWLLGWVLYGAVASRRHVVWTNLRLCFPDWPHSKLRLVSQQTFVHFAQAWLDRGWLWHGSEYVVRQRLRITGATDALQGEGPVVIFAPHFVGLDAGWTALTQQIASLPQAAVGQGHHFSTLYSHQSNLQVDAWVLAGRKRFGNPRMFDRFAGPKPLVTSLREGGLLYLLPDMNYGLQESVFVPFYGVPAATVTSLSRLARLGRARIVPVVTRMTPNGYDVQVMPTWTDMPTGDVTGDTLLMNQRLESYINAMPAQYYWVHKRFKDRPAGTPSVY